MAVISRRQFIGLSAVALPAFAAADAFCLEPTFLARRNLRLNLGLNARFVHFTDLHYKGDRDYVQRVVNAINAERPEFVCFTGDLVEDRRFAPEALEFIRKIEAPVYGCAGNHDYRSGADFAKYEEAFVATGGAWLEDRALVLEKFGFEIVGTGRLIHEIPASQSARRLLLLHYPAAVEGLAFNKQRFDLILSGHSHGGQVRLPFFGALIVPHGVGPYELGLYQTAAGPMYVSSGVGTLYLPVRFNCRPEIVVLEA